MKNMLKLSFAALVLLQSTIALQAMEVKNLTVEHEKIAPNNIYSLQSKMSPEDAGAIKEWAEKNRELLHKLVPVNEDVILDRTALKDALPNLIKLIKDANLTSVGNHNIVIPVQLNGKTKFIHITSPIIRAINLLHSNINPETKDFYGWQMDKITTDLKPVDTYQTVSQLEHYLNAKEAIRKHNIKEFNAPETNLVQIPGRADISKHACDANSITVQDEQVGFVQLKDNLKKIESLSTQAIQDGYQVVKAAPCWDAFSNMRIKEDGSLLGYVDWEQASNRGAHKFGTTNTDIVNYYKVCAIEGYAKSFQEAQKNGHSVSEQVKEIRSLVLNDPELNQFSSGHVDQLKKALPQEQ